VNQGIGQDFDIERLRERLHKLSERELIQFGKDVRYLRSPEANFSKPPLEVWAAQLREGCEEWRRRHPKTKENTK
jgi:hypothetical protein